VKGSGSTGSCGDRGEIPRVVNEWIGYDGVGVVRRARRMGKGCGFEGRFFFFEAVKERRG